jgi:hypothetical protein
MRVTLWQRPARPLLSRLRAFEMRGVMLKHPSRSWSGVRADDGAVVLALWADDILSDDQGSSCLLWSPHPKGALVRMDLVSSEERRGHCRLALLHGAAEGLLVYGDTAAVDPEIVLALRVAERCNEYWATWGSVTRLVGRRATEAPSASPRQACG